MKPQVDGFVLRGGLRGKRAEMVSIFPVPRRANWPRRESTTAVGADISKDFLDALCAESAFERTYPRFQRIGWERLLTMFAGWPEGERHQDVELFVAHLVFAGDIFF
jgi:hypothetical protein